MRLIFTHPLYHDAHLGDWAELSSWAKRKLVPGGVLLAYSGTGRLLRVMNDMAAHLDFMMPLVIRFDGTYKAYRGNEIAFLQGWRPLLWYTKGPWEQIKGRIVKSIYHSPKFEKDWYKWQMPLDFVLYYMERFTETGDLVVDPMAGGFTTAVAAHRLGRRYLGGDLLPECLEIGRRRLSAEL